MSIQTELSRIINAKAAIKAAIEGKGVTVPEATLLDGMAALIESIEAGGVLKYIEGSFTLAEDTTEDFTIPIDCSPLMNDGENKSNFVLTKHCSIIIWADWDSFDANAYGSVASYYILNKSTGTRATGQVGFSGTSNPTIATASYGILPENESLTYRFKNNNSYIGLAGSSYRYLVVRLY